MVWTAGTPAPGSLRRATGYRRVTAGFIVLVLVAACAAPSSSSTPAGGSPTPGGGSAAPTDAPSEPTQLVIVMPSELSGRGPWQGAAPDHNAFNMNMYDPLVRGVIRNGEARTIGVLAKSWSNPDPLTWRFELYEEATFSDGSPVTAEDVAYTYTRIKEDPTSLVTDQMEPITEIVAVDEHTVEMKTERPVATLLINIQDRIIQKKAYLEDVGWEEADENPVGSGPYELVEWLPGERYVVELRDEYWGAEANPEAYPAVTAGTAPDRVIYRFISEAEAQVTSLLNAEADWIPSIPPHLVSRVEDGEGVHLATGQDTSHYFFIMNPITEAMEKVEVRQAIYHAIDVQALVDGPLQGAATALDGPLLPGSLSYVDDLQKYPYDPDKARELLAAAGYANGLTIDFPCPDGFYTGEKEICDATSGMLADVGINAPVRMVEYATYNTENRDNQYEFFVARNGMTAGDPGLYDSWFLCTNDRISFCDEAFTDPYLEQAGIVDVDDRVAVLEEAWRALMANPPVVFLFRLDDAFGLSDRIEWEYGGGTPNPGDVVMVAP